MNVDCSDAREEDGGKVGDVPDSEVIERAAHDRVVDDDTLSHCDNGVEDIELYRKEFDEIRSKTEMLAKERLQRMSYAKKKYGGNSGMKANGTQVQVNGGTASSVTGNGANPAKESVFNGETIKDILKRKLFGAGWKKDKSGKEGRNKDDIENSDGCRKTQADDEHVTVSKTKEDQRVEVDAESPKSREDENKDNVPAIIVFENTRAKWKYVITNRTVLELCIGSAVVFVTYTSIFTIAPNAADDYG